MKRLIPFVLIVMLIFTSCATSTTQDGYPATKSHSESSDLIEAPTHAITNNNTATEVQTESDSTAEIPDVTSDETSNQSILLSPTDTGVQPEPTVPTENNDDTPATDVSNDNPAIGGTDYCPVHYPTYHMIGGGIIDYIGEERYEGWKNTLRVDDPDLPEGCNRVANIKMLIDYFDIPLDYFAEACSFPSDSSYNLNLLYNGTIEEIDAYYRDFENFIHEPDRLGHYDWVYDIIWLTYEEEIAELNLNQAKHNIFKLSLPEVVYKLDIKQDELAKIFAEAAQNCINTHGVCYTFDYNLDMIYGDGELQAGEMTFASLEELLAVNADGDPDNDISSNELSEMFCRVGRYAE